MTVTRDLLVQAYEAAQESDDKRTWVGCVLVTDDWSFRTANGLPSPLLHRRLRFGAKSTYVEHAERRALYRAARFGVATDNATMYCTWAACTECARAIVASGIARVVRHAPAHAPAHDRWAHSLRMGNDILSVAGVEIIDYVDPIPEAPNIMRDGRWWQP